MSKSFVPYTDSVEQIQPDEQKTFDDIAATMHDIMHKIGDRQRHTTRAVHAKSHALIKAKMTIKGGLPEPSRPGAGGATGHLRNGSAFFHQPGRYPFRSHLFAARPGHENRRFGR